MDSIRYEQTRLEENEEYKAFVDKFKPKKTTDDCYTPQMVYDAVLDYCVERYGINKENVKRPFWPGGDYESEQYQEGCIVVDNPPFSMITKICKWYMMRGIRFFLFAPYLTNFTICRDELCHVICDANVTYENGAEVNTSFVTNMEPGTVARSDPKLRKLVEEASRNNLKLTNTKKEKPKYSYNDHVLTATMVGYMSAHGVEYEVKKESVMPISQLDAQRLEGKAIFGSGFLLSTKAAAERAAAERAAAERAAAERAAAIKWGLSEREKEMIKQMDRREQDGSQAKAMRHVPG